MSKFTLLFVAYFFTLFADATCEGIAKSQINEIASYAIQYRVDKTLTVAEEQERKKRVLEQACSHLLHYEIEVNLDGAIEHFIRDFLVATEFDFSIIDTAETNLTGHSLDRTFLVEDRNGKLIYVVKAFRNPRQLSSRFLPEISAMLLIQSLGMSHVAKIEPLACAIYNEGPLQWGLLLESAAPGKRLDEYLFELGNQSTTDNREHCLKVPQRAFERAGKSFAKLHAVKTPTQAYIPAYNLSQYDNKLTEVLSNSFILNALSNHFSIKEFVGYINQVKEAIVHTPVFYTYWHGDAHLGNLFYDEALDLFAFIDLGKMHYSVDTYGQPLVDGTQDLLRVEESLRRNALNILTQEEIESLLACFYEAYENHSGQLPDKKLLLFYKTYAKLSRLASYSRYINTSDPVQKSIEKTVFEDAVKYFINQINPQI